MEAASLTTSPSPNGALSRRTPLLRFQTDERLVALMREGHERAFELLFKRYQARLFAFCRRLLGSPEDAEDVLQEVFAAAHAAILADSRPINARPWLYRIARNQCVNHLREPSAVGVDSMDVHPYEHGASTLEQVETARGAAGDRRRRPRAAKEPAHGARPARGRRLLLCGHRPDDGHHASLRQVSAGPGAHVAGPVEPGARGARAARTAGAAPKAAPRKARRQLGRRRATAGGVAGTPGTAAAAGGSGLTFSGVVSAATTGLGGALGAKAAVGVATAALVAAGAVGVEKMDLGGHGQTAEPAGRRPPPKLQPQAGRRPPGPPRELSRRWAPPRARRRGPVRVTGRARRPASRPSGDLPDLGRSVTRATGDATRAAAAGASAATEAVASTTSAVSDAASAAAASVKPPKSDVPPVPRLGDGTGLSDVQAPRLSDRHSLPPKLGPAQTLIP